MPQGSYFVVLFCTLMAPGEGGGIKFKLFYSFWSEDFLLDYIWGSVNWLHYFINGLLLTTIDIYFYMHPINILPLIKF